MENRKKIEEALKKDGYIYAVNELDDVPCADKVTKLETAAYIDSNDKECELMTKEEAKLKVPHLVSWEFDSYNSKSGDICICLDDDDIEY
jgi:hypothetical protein